MPFVPRSLSAGILRSQNSIRSPPLWETQPAGAFGDRRQIPPLKQFQGYLTSTSHAVHAPALRSAQIPDIHSYIRGAGGEASLPGSGVSPANFPLSRVCLRRRQVMSGCQKFDLTFPHKYVIIVV